jgi:glycosyltransferase involved in cell wall biosynthesis
VKIGINLLWLVPGRAGGLETYVRGLVGGLESVAADAEFILFTNPQVHQSFERLQPNFRRVLYPIPSRPTALRLLSEQLILPLLARRARVDVLHGPANMVPILAQCPTVMTLHDLHFFELPEILPGAKGALLRAMVRLGARRARRLLTISEFSRNRISKRFRIATDLIGLSYMAPKPIVCLPEQGWPKLARRFGIANGYVMAISHSYQHKNIPRLMSAFARARNGSGLQLVLAGRAPKRGPSLRLLARELGIESSVIFTDFVSDTEMRALMQHAAVFAYPSLYEGFGIPVVEAMTCGVPVVASTAGPLPEVAGGAALLIDPTDTDAIAGAITRVMSDPELRQKLSERGRERAHMFSWESAARATMRVYQECSAL